MPIAPLRSPERPAPGERPRTIAARRAIRPAPAERPGALGRLATAALGILVLAAASIAAPPAGAQEAGRVAITAINQLEYSLATSADRDTTKPHEIFEDWLDVDIRSGRALIGFRYEAFQPHEARPDSVREGFVQRYAEFSLGPGSVRAGNWYEIFGKGMIFRAYEDRSLRVDSDMDGVLVKGDVAGLSGKAFSGRMRDVRTDERRDVLHGLDLEGRPFSWATLGGSYLVNSGEAPNPLGLTPPPQPRTEEALAARASIAHPTFDLYGEAATVNRLSKTAFDVARGLDYEDLRGTGHYASLSVYPLQGVAVTGEYKNYDEFRFHPTDAPGTNYNNPPALTRETSYTLITRHPHVLDPDDEKGWQVEALASHDRYGSLTLNRSETDRQDGRTYFHETYGEYKKTLGDRIDATIAYDDAEDAESGTENRTPVADLVIRGDGEQSLRLEYQYQNSESDLGTETTHFALAEYHVNFDLTLSAVGETGTFLEALGPSESDERRENFAYAQADWHVTEEQFLSVTVGKRRAGYICVGGICRFEPAFEGVEFRYITTF